MPTSKTKLIISIVSFIIVIALLVTGVTLFFILKDRRDDIIQIEGSNVDIVATPVISGMENPPVLEPIVISENSEQEQKWENVHLVFAEKTSEIVISLTIVNNNQQNGLNVIFDNQTTTNNVNMQEQYYLNGNVDEITNLRGSLAGDRVVPVTTQLSALGSITYVITFTIKDAGSSVNDTLDIMITCMNVDNEL